MSAIEIIKEKYPERNCKIEGNWITIEPVSSSGFSVWLIDNDSAFTVGFDGWHEEFDELGEALNCFDFGLSAKCRLKVIKRGNKPYSWTLQTWNGSDWDNGGFTRMIFIPFWRKKTVHYLSNEEK